IVRLDVDDRRGLSRRRVADSPNRVPLDAQADDCGRGDGVAIRATERAIEDRDAPCVAVSVGTTADRDVVLWRAVDVEPAECRLVTVDRNAVRLPPRRDDDAQVADRHADRRSPRGPRAVDEEDCARGDRIPVYGTQPDRTEPERDDARAVRGNGRVVVRNPEAAGRIALAVRKPGQIDRPAAAVEPRLQPGSVVARGPGSRRHEAGGCERPLRGAHASSQDRRPSVALEDVVVESDPY